MSKFFKKAGPFSLSNIAEELNLDIYLGGQKVNNLDLEINDIDTLKNASNNSLSFFSNKKYLPDFQSTKAGACITSSKYINDAPNNLPLLISENPYASFALISNKFYQTVPRSNGKISDNADISPDAKIGNNVEIMANSHISSSARIGNNVKILSNVYIGNDVEIGDNSVIHHSVTIQKSIIGKNTIIHPGARIGQDGFGYAFDKGNYIKVPQIGGVIIGNNVEIGANTTIDRGTIENTEIGDMSKIDNLVQIGHNVKIGIGCVIVSQVGISGSTKIGNYAQIAGQAGIAGHLQICDKAQIAAQSGVIQDVKDETPHMGTPALPLKQFLRNFATLKKITNKG